jgi:hypothetical protein
MAAPRFGAPRALVVLGPGGTPLQGQLTQPCWTPDGSALYFTREWSGTRNVWRATPSRESGGRFAPWQAEAVTALRAPLFADSARVLPDGRSLVLATNSVNPAGSPLVGQLARLDGRSGSLQALTSGPYYSAEPALTARGDGVAFTTNRPGFESVYLLNLPEVGRNAELPRRAVLRAHFPCWTGDGSLLFDNLRPLSTGLFVLSPGAPGDQPALVTTPGGQCSVSQSGAWIALCTQGPGDAGQLFVLAQDGSGLRALTGTEGARDPDYAPGGDQIAYDAPVSRGARAPRGLWIVPLLRDPPVARLHSVEPASPGSYSVVGTMSGDGAVGRLEVGQGTSPRHFDTLATVAPPVLNAPIALWTPPRDARGPWTLRLTVSTASGGTTQALLLVTLPLEAIEAPTAAPPDAVASLPTVVQPRVPQPNPLPPPASSSPPASLPSAPVPVVPLPSTAAPVRPLPPRAEPPRPVVVPAPATPKQELPPSSPPSPVRESAVPRRPAAVAADSGELNVAGTLAKMAPGQVATVTVWVKNTGRLAWPVDGRHGAVRVVARWIDFKTGTRRKWAYAWLREEIKPGQSSRWTMELAAPETPGKYKLIYGLLRLGEGRYKPPASSAGQDKWPGEFAAIAFAVTVR